MADRTEVALWPETAGPEYVEARRRLTEAERDLRDSLERVAAARRALPQGAPVGEYVFAEGPRDLSADGPVSAATLLDLFGEHDTLVVYHLMFKPDDDQACPMCSMWVDGLHGVSHHIAQHAGFAVIAKAGLAELRAWGTRRGWTGLRLLSSRDTTFNYDLRAEDADGEQRPGLSVFTREGSDVRHAYTVQASYSVEEPERGIDLLSPVWQVLDLLPKGRGSWYADNDYPGAGRG